MNISKEFKVGLFGLLSLGLLFFGYNYLKGKQFFVKKLTIHAVYDNISGLSETNPVQINGLEIGRVMKLSMIPGGGGKILATMTIDDEIMIPKNSIALISSSDLLGSKVIELKYGNSSENVSLNDTLKSGIEMSLQDRVDMQLLPVKKKAEDLLASMDSVMTIVKYIFNENARANIESSFATINTSLKAFQDASFELKGLITEERVKVRNIFSHLESISSNLNANNENISKIIANSVNITDTLSKSNLFETINRASKAFAQAAEIIEKANNGEGSIGLLLRDDVAYKNFAQSVADLDKLLADIRLNPDRYVHFSLFNIGGSKGYKETEKKESESSNLKIIESQSE